MKAHVVVLLISLVLKHGAAKNIFTIGGLFHEDNYDVEVAFKYAIARQNMFNHDINYKTITHRISRNDLFSTSKTVCDMTSRDDGVVAIFGPEALQTSAMVQSVCANLEIPQIQISWKPTTSYNSQTVLNLYPDPDLISLGLSTLVRHMDWKSYVILYQNNDGLVRLQEVFKIPDVGDSPITVRQLDENGDYRSLLKEIKQSMDTQIILDCDTDIILDILGQAKEVGFLDFFHSYLLTSLDAHTLDFSALDTSANITTIRIVDPDNPALHNAVRDWEIGELNNDKHVVIPTTKVRTEAALMHDAVNLFTATLPELHITQEINSEPLLCNETTTWRDGYRLVTYMKVRPMLNSVTGPIRFNEQGKRIDFTLQVVEIAREKVSIIATWSPEFPHELNFTRNASQQMQQVVENLQKTTVIVSSRIGSPYLMRREPKYAGELLEGNAEFEGYSLDLIDEIAKELNFTYKFILAEDGKYGNYDEKKKAWNGLIKDLLDRRAHLAICDLTITHKRREVVDFSMPFMTLGVSILYRKAKQEERNIFAFMDPLETEVWMYIATAYISVTVCMYLISRMAPGDWEKPHPCDQDPAELENIWTLKNCLWLLLGSTMSQGCDILPKGISSRMGISMWWFFILIISSSYTANLAAFLTMERMGPTIDSAEALAKQTKIKYGTVEGGATQSFFRESNFSTYNRMWTQMSTSRPSVFEKGNGDGVKRVVTTRNSLYAFLMESSSIEYEIERNCELKQVGGRLDSKGYGIAMPVNSPYRSAINKAVLKMQEEGKLNMLKKKWWKEMHGGGACDESSADEEANANELALANVGGVFLVLGLGVGLALCFAIIEFLWNVRQVSVEEHISYWGAFVLELKFATNVWVTKKRVRPQISEKSSDNGSETRSIAQKIHRAGSFLHLDMFDKIGMNKNL